MAGNDDEERYHTNVLLEDIRAKQTALFEGMTAWRDELRREFREEFAKVHTRLEILEGVVRQNSAGIRQNSEAITRNSEGIKKNSEDICRLDRGLTDLRVEVRDLKEEVRDLKEEVRRLRADFDGRQELARIAALEERVGELERKVNAG